MTAPFPGMDPYLESPEYWVDFHARFINYWCEAIADRLPEDYEATLGERVYVHEPSRDELRMVVPDVSVRRTSPKREATSPEGEWPRTEADSPAVGTIEPVTIPLLILEEPTETYIEILHGPDRELIAVLDLLSPANKNKPGRGDYLSKRNAIIGQRVHLIELDLLLGGQRLPMRAELPVGDYFYFLSPADRRPDCDVYAWKLEDPLPTVPIPLRPPDPDLWVSLAAVFADVFDRGRYAKRIDREKDLPHLHDEFRLQWVRERLG